MDRLFGLSINLMSANQLYYPLDYLLSTILESRFKSHIIYYLHPYLQCTYLSELVMQMTFKGSVDVSSCSKRPYSQVKRVYSEDVHLNLNFIFYLTRLPFCD